MNLSLNCRASDEYREGAKNFVEMSEKLAVIYGIDPTYKIWFHHGEELSRDDDVETMETFDSYNLFRATNIDGCDFESHLEDHDDTFMEKLEDADTPLYPQFTKYTKLSSIVALYKLKTTNGWSDKSFDELLRLLNDMLPLDNMIPKSIKDKENLQECPTCGTSRWMSDKLTKKVRHGVPEKVLRYFPIIPRLKRMFMSKRISKELRWHHNNKSCDGKMRHPVDSAAWELVNDKWPSFSNEERNIRLGLSTNGFNPFKDLKLLWNEGVDAHDALDNTNFKLRAILMWTIQDFPAYRNLAGCKNKGCFSCPLCGYGTHSEWLKHSGKFSYRGHRKFLKEDHPFQSKRSWFDGEEEHGNPPRIMNGTTIVEHLKDFELYVHHNLDVMHIEKNVCESICNTLLDVAGKSKDGLKARLDLQHMGIRSALHPQEKGTRTYLPAALHTLSKLEKELFCKRLFSLKVPDGYSSNIRNCISMEQCKLMGLKSHDCHILMQQLLPVAIKGLMPLGPRDAIIRLCTFFNRICQRVLDRESIMALENDVIETLCLLEIFFPPSFFDVMIHLVVPMHSSTCDETDLLKWLAYGPRKHAASYTRYIINGQRFHIHDIEKSTQNSGVSIEATTMCRSSAKDVSQVPNLVSYYGVIREIILLEYYIVQIPIFKCD
ncbi:uncharacterized protein LOC133785417 [Humulus lupulus]|uniref:uncharacterized protein LOC133785417 n=1 Tax=Humulus lupulus TaxID=3486 RepID=UPI002B4071F3|nr:uncharacterized protein LOC133785417 [Humulus lupulus]